jgi:SAM-dependent methyltransferase
VTSSDCTFGRDYFEDGVEQKISCYENYRWIPELTIPLAHHLIFYLKIGRSSRVLDFGCAKGYLVYAFHLLGHKNTFGVDVSRYALSCAPAEVREYLKLVDSREVNPYKQLDLIIAKDVFEHLSLEELEKTLRHLRGCTDRLFVVVPLGQDGVYESERDNLDVTHKICKCSEWWLTEFELRGFTVANFAKQLWFLKNGRSGFGYFTLS